MRLLERVGQSFVVTAELEPPRGSNAEKLIEQARQVKPFVHAVNLTDAPMANLRMNAPVAAHLVERDAGVEAVFHFTCRDRNILALQAELLGAAALGLKNVLTLTGDPPARGDHPDAKGVFEVDLLELIDVVRTLNAGRSRGRDLDSPTDFTIIAAANPGAKDLEVERSKFCAKVEAGASLFQTQPIFSVEEVLRFREVFSGKPPAPVLYGVLPLRSVKMARNVAKWCNVPEELVEALELEGAAAGLRWAKRTIDDLKAFGVDGVHLYPLGKMEVVREVLEPLTSSLNSTASDVILEPHPA